MLNELPFYRFFSDLRERADLSLGPAQLADLQRLLLAVRPQTAEAILSLCKVLWLQKPEAKAVFERLFWKHWKKLKEAFVLELEAEAKGAVLCPQVESSLPEAVELEESRFPVVKEEKKISPSPQTELDSKPIRNSSHEEPPTGNRGIWLHFKETEAGVRLGLPNQASSPIGLTDHAFVLTAKYWPLPARKLQQCWRYLRNEHQKTVSEEMNRAATVAMIAAGAWIDRPVYERKRTPEAQDVHILLDYGGSMRPFVALSEYLASSIAVGLKPQRFVQWYFRNQPREKLYGDKSLIQGYPIKKWRRSLSRSSLIVIISDAGAARDGLEEERVVNTRAFLEGIQSHSNRVIWINPLPKERWFGNSAVFISLFVEMIGADKADLQRLPEILKKWQ